MHFISASATAILALTVNASPLALTRRTDDDTTYTSLKSRSALAIASENRLVDRQGTWYQNKYVQGTFGLAVGLAKQGKDVWKDLINTCSEFNGDNKIESRVDCVYDVGNVLFWGAIEGYLVYSGAEKLVNSLGVAGIGKRTAGSQFDWAQQWASLNDTQQSQARSHIPSPNGFWLHSMDNGISELDDSVAFHFATDSSNLTRIRHVTNGTHGLIHTTDDASTSNISRRNVFTWDKGVAGVKLSYQLPCQDEYIPQTAGNQADLMTVIQKWIGWTTSEENMSDAYNIELEDVNTGRNIMLGTFIAEQSGFGTDYEGLGFTPEDTCSEY